MDSEDVRDEKVKVLRAMKPLTMDDVILGQYEGYTFDPDVPDGSNTETYAMAVMKIENQRWHGVPFVVKCGKAVNERKCEIRIQFEESPLPYHAGANRNELVRGASLRAPALPPPRASPDRCCCCRMFCPGLTVNLLNGGSAAYACGVCRCSGSSRTRRCTSRPT